MDSRVWRWVLCPSCLGTGMVYQHFSRSQWPCPHCEGEPHPSLQVQEIKMHKLKKVKQT